MDWLCANEFRRTYDGFDHTFEVNVFKGYGKLLDVVIVSWIELNVMFLVDRVLIGRTILLVVQSWQWDSRISYDIMIDAVNRVGFGIKPTRLWFSFKRKVMSSRKHEIFQISKRMLVLSCIFLEVCVVEDALCMNLWMLWPSIFRNCVAGNYWCSYFRYLTWQIDWDMLYGVLMFMWHRGRLGGGHTLYYEYTCAPIISYNIPWTVVWLLELSYLY